MSALFFNLSRPFIIYIHWSTILQEEFLYAKIINGVQIEFFDDSSIQNNVTAILDKLQRGYDKRVRPNYGGKWMMMMMMMMMTIYDMHTARHMCMRIYIPRNSPRILITHNRILFEYVFRPIRLQMCANIYTQHRLTVHTHLERMSHIIVCRCV